MTTVPNGIDADYKQALGELVYQTSKLDSRLTDLIGAMTNTTIIEAMILVHHQQFANKLDGLKALFRIIYPDDEAPNYQSIKKMLDRLKIVADFRNTIVHAMWTIGDDGVPLAVRFSARGKFSRSRQPAPVEKLRQFSLEAIDLAGTLGMLAQGYREFEAASRQSQPEQDDHQS